MAVTLDERRAGEGSPTRRRAPGCQDLRVILQRLFGVAALRPIGFAFLPGGPSWCPNVSVRPRTPQRRRIPCSRCRLSGSAEPLRRAVTPGRYVEPSGLAGGGGLSAPSAICASIAAMAGSLGSTPCGHTAPCRQRTAQRTAQQTAQRTAQRTAQYATVHSDKQSGRRRGGAATAAAPPGTCGA